MAVNDVDNIYEVIKNLPPYQREKLYKRLGVELKQEKKKDKFFDELIGIAKGPKNKGSRTYKGDLYGGARPLKEPII